MTDHIKVRLYHCNFYNSLVERFYMSTIRNNDELNLIYKAGVLVLNRTLFHTFVLYIPANFEGAR